MPLEVCPFHFFCRHGSVVAYFSIIFNSPSYELITPLIDAINQTVGHNEVNYLGDMAIQLWNVQPKNGMSCNIPYFRSSAQSEESDGASEGLWVPLRRRDGSIKCCFI